MCVRPPGASWAWLGWAGPVRPHGLTAHEKCPYGNGSSILCHSLAARTEMSNGEIFVAVGVTITIPAVEVRNVWTWTFCCRPTRFGTTMLDCRQPVTVAAERRDRSLSISSIKSLLSIEMSMIACESRLQERKHGEWRGWGCTGGKGGVNCNAAIFQISPVSPRNIQTVRRSERRCLCAFDVSCARLVEI